MSSDQMNDNSISLVQKENDELFLDLIKDRPCLYKKNSSDYHDKIVTENAMEEIAFVMHDSVENCEKKWLSFKQAYTKEKSMQELESRSGAGASTRKKWMYFNKMKELFSMDSSSRSSYSNISTENTNETPKNKEVTQPPRWRNYKRKAVNPVESALNNIHASISRVLQSQTDENATPESVDCNVDVLVGKIIKARLNQISSTVAKKKRKLIMKCLIDNDSESDQD